MRKELHRISPLLSSTRIIVIYFIISLLWILLSDRAVTCFFNDIPTITMVQTWKGWGFVLVTSLIMFVLFYRDMKIIDHQKKQIKESLVEKESLLKEIHHRVKNNMQVITSLLRLQSRETSDSVDQLVSITSSRIQTMALVHEILYVSDRISVIDFNTYTNRIIAEVINKSLKLPVHFRIDNETQHIEMGMDTAIPCGLVMVELLVLAAKNKDSESIHITIRAEKIDHDYIEILIFDDSGIMSKACNEQSSTSNSMELILILIDQLKGTIDSDQLNIPGIKIIFPLK
ncbi:MAG: sensor histidine kinase [Spirochaetota bacterium]